MKNFSVEMILNMQCENCGAWFSKASPTVSFANLKTIHCIECGYQDSLTDEQKYEIRTHIANIDYCRMIEEQKEQDERRTKK